MAWRTITEDDLFGVLNATESAAYQAAAVAEGQDPLEDAITTVVNLCRGYIGDNPANQLAEGLKLPERAILPALHLLRVEMLTRLDLPVSDDRRSARTEAIRFFERVADGKVAIEAPEGAVEASTSAPGISTIDSRDRIATRTKLSGL